uniref:Uncharacterized protein n=1 Tax=Spironucleus salmonicida TaxID=348837 RepID=V6LC22_9EUKA|eukprot:EST42017.1 Hypothetical protein SS50377_18324 [Spironucleus salmonicida]
MSIKICRVRQYGVKSTTAIYNMTDEKITINNHDQLQYIKLLSKDVTVIRDGEFIQYNDVKQKLEVQIPISQTLPVAKIQAKKEIEIEFTPKSSRVYEGEEPTRDAFQVLK